MCCRCQITRPTILGRLNKLVYAAISETLSPRPFPDVGRDACISSATIALKGSTDAWTGGNWIP
jgi:hypothetical protein